ncbi:hydroxymethylpyrimidine pyrophosphatase-like HAD family hydrolase [Microbacterium testaceum]|nr:hydroxymethylpyrimidine pyrophosphatase-like HAD family hydrolase [Microbacterium testaceum]
MTRIAFLDVDGTILEHGSLIAPSTVTAIRQARANGHQVWLSTGRSAGDVHPDVLAIGFDGAITNGGAYATRGEEMLVEQPLPRADVELLERYFEAHGIHYFLQTHGGVFASEGMGAVMTAYRRERHAERAAQLAEQGLTAEEPLWKEPRPVAEVDRDAVAKAVFVSPSIDTVAHAAAELGAAFHVIPGSIPLPGGSNGEIGQAGVTKGSRDHLGARAAGLARDGCHRHRRQLERRRDVRGRRDARRHGQRGARAAEARRSGHDVGAG